MGSDYLFATPSFVTGAARSLDLGAVFDEYNTSPTGAAADAIALTLDWLTVGDALIDAADEMTIDSAAVSSELLCVQE